MRGNAQDPMRTFMNIDNGIELMNDNIIALKSQTINLQENIRKTKVDPEKMFNELRKKQNSMKREIDFVLSSIFSNRLKLV